MTVGNADLAEEALDKTLEVREEAGLPFGTPVNVYDLCEKLSPKVRVRFADYSMEGCYHRSSRPLIEVSALRPLGRRVFNTAHELGPSRPRPPGDAARRADRGRKVRPGLRAGGVRSERVRRVPLDAEDRGAAGFRRPGLEDARSPAPKKYSRSPATSASDT